MSSSKSTDKNGRLEAWFPLADSGSDSYVAGQHLSGKLAAIRKLLPLPLEQIAAPDQLGLAELAERIETAKNTKAVIMMAYKLKSRELDLVFPLLAVVANAIAPDREASRQADLLIDRLTLVIRERACQSMYLSGWLTLQKYYPCPPVARALAVLCRILEIKQESAQRIELGIRQNMMAEKPLISQIAPPDSRQFIPRLVRELTAGKADLDFCLTRYQIDPELPFAIALLGQCFLTDNLEVFQNSYKLFGRALRQSDSATRTQLLHHFFALAGLPVQARNRCCQQIYRVFDDPTADHPIWSQVKEKDRDAFKIWVRSATIGSHCREHPEKARVYLAYDTSIVYVEQWDAGTLLIHFKDFLIADSRRYPDMAIYYDKIGADGNPFDLTSSEFNPNPADPKIPCRPIDDALHGGDFSGIIGLPFDRDGIRLTKLFLDIRLKDKRGGVRRLLGN